jgi:hypothetical protein
MKKIISILSLSFLISCSSIHGVPLTDKKEGWFNGVRKGDAIVPPNPFSIFNPFLTRGFLYCKANDIEGSALANPICYEVKYSTYNSEKPRYENDKTFEKKSKN